MAAVVPFASCYASAQPLQLFGRGPRGGNYMALLTYRGPRFTPRPHLTCHPPKMTLRQICRMLKVMKQIRNREAAAAAAASQPQRHQKLNVYIHLDSRMKRLAFGGQTSTKQGSASPTPASPGAKSEKKCLPSCLRRKRSIKRVG